MLAPHGCDSVPQTLHGIMPTYSSHLNNLHDVNELFSFAALAKELENPDCLFALLTLYGLSVEYS